MKRLKPISIQSLLKNKPNQNKFENTHAKVDNSSVQDLSTNLISNLNDIKEQLGNSSDIVVREFLVGLNDSLQMAVIYTDGLADKNFVQNYILETLMVDIRNKDLHSNTIAGFNTFEIIKKNALTCAEVKEIGSFKQLFHHVLSGDTVLLLDQFNTAMAIGSRGWADRGVQEPSSQSVVRGPKDGFSETLRMNTALIRRRIKDPSLRIETKQIGQKTNTDVSIIYMEGLANSKIVEEVRNRINKINIDAILESGYIEELIQDETYTPFPTIFNTERPDAAASAILEGRVVIMVDGTPFVLIVPALMVHFFQSSEDYYQRADVSTLIRILRYFAFFLALITPSAYIAVTTYHQEMIPTPLLLSLAAQREGVPFPAFIEALMMEVTFEILREAGIRMPRAVGSAISIVGALVIGQAAVEAGIVSSAMVIVVSLTAISSFVSPTFNMSIAVRMLRFPLMILAATFGLFGMIMGLIMMVLHLTSLRSFGIPYMAPNGPFILQDQKDAMIRLPHWAMDSRNRLVNQQNIIRNQTPAPKPGENTDNLS